MNVKILCLAIILNLFFSCQGNRSSKPTFYKDIAPITYKNCVKCHHSEGLAPFNLIEYADYKKRLKTIDFVIRHNIMPPWPADPNYSHFVGELALSESEKQTLTNWIQQGAPEGNKAELRVKPDIQKYPAFGKPDLTIKPYQFFEIKGDGKDKFFTAKIPVEIPHDTFVQFIEFVPQPKSLIHHLNGRLLNYNNRKNLHEGSYYEPVYERTVEELNATMKLKQDDGTEPEYVHSVVNYLPGAVSTRYPQGIGGFKLNKKSYLFLNDIHFGATPTSYIDSSYFNFYFMPKPPIRSTRELQLGTLGISSIIPDLIIPPNEVKKFVTRGRIVNDVSILTINPHMHLLGKRFKAFAVEPSGDTIPLIHIPRWDFRWQYFYTFKKMLHLKAGTDIIVEAWMDNTENNPNNPFHPPRTISERNGSMSTTDEMLQLIITFLPYEKGDENISLE